MAALPTEFVNPYLTYNFLVKWDGKYVATVTRVSGLTRRTQVVHPPRASRRSPRLRDLPA